MNDQDKILFFKKLINENKEEDFKTCMSYITYEGSRNTFDIDIDGAFFFQKIFLHSCFS